MQITPAPFNKPIPVRGYNGAVIKRPVTYAIYPKFALTGYEELIILMMITNLSHNTAILGKFWINRHKVLLNFENDSIIFRKNFVDLPFITKLYTPDNILWLSDTPQQREFPLGFPSDPPSQLSDLNPKSKSIPKIIPKILPRLKAASKNEREFTTRGIGAAAYHLLAKNAKQDKTEIFAISVQDMDLLIAQDRNQQATAVELANMEFANVTYNELMDKLPDWLHNIADVFDKSKAEGLFFYRFYNHKIEFTGQKELLRNRPYRMSPFKTEKVKEYLQKNLQKRYIAPSKAAYFHLFCLL